MKLASLLVLILAFGGGVGYAEIGETEAQCEALHGVPVSTFAAGQRSYTPYEVINFIKDGYKINSHFKDGKLSGLAFLKVDGSEINTDEINALLQENLDGNTWKEGAPDSTTRTWIRSDGARAFYSLDHRFLAIMGKEEAAGPVTKHT